jgi:hypothetical protein
MSYTKTHAALVKECERIAKQNKDAGKREEAQQQLNLLRIMARRMDRTRIPERETAQ